MEVPYIIWAEAVLPSISFVFKWDDWDVFEGGFVGFCEELLELVELLLVGVFDSAELVDEVGFLAEDLGEEADISRENIECKLDLTDLNHAVINVVDLEPMWSSLVCTDVVMSEFTLGWWVFMAWMVIKIVIYI